MKNKETLMGSLRERERRNRMERLFDLASRTNGDGLMEAARILEKEEQRGRESERLVEETLLEMVNEGCGIEEVTMSDVIEDRVKLVDFYLKTSWGARWRVQVKSSLTGQQKAISKLSQQWKGLDRDGVLNRMAKNRMMLINAQMGENEMEKKLNIREQVQWWFDRNRAVFGR